MADIATEDDSEVQWLRARVIALEAELAMLRGSMAPHPAADEPGAITHDVPPNAPR
jgi:hypothetical protein